jgi:hypothetical protein
MRSIRATTYELRVDQPSIKSPMAAIQLPDMRTARRAHWACSTATTCPAKSDMSANSKQAIDRAAVGIRPSLPAPQVPAGRVALYRKAFGAVLEDPQFRAASERQRLSNDRQIEAPLPRAYAAPKRIHDRAAVLSAEMN